MNCKYGKKGKRKVEKEVNVNKNYSLFVLSKQAICYFCVMTKKRDPIALLKKYPDRKFSTTELIETLLSYYEAKEEAFSRLFGFQNGEKEEYEGEKKGWEYTFDEANEAFEIVKKADLLAWEAFEYLGYVMYSFKKIEIPKIRRKVTEAKITFKYSDTISKAIEDMFELEKWYPSIEMREFLTNLFKELDIPVKAKATDVKAFYRATFKKLRIDGIQTAAFKLEEKYPKVKIAEIVDIKERKPRTPRIKKAEEEKGTE